MLVQPEHERPAAGASQEDEARYEALLNRPVDDDGPDSHPLCSSMSSSEASSSPPKPVQCFACVAWSVMHLAAANQGRATTQ